MKAVCLLLRLTCYELCEQLVVAVDDVDRHVSGRLQKKWTALRRDARALSLCWWWSEYFNLQCDGLVCVVHTAPTMQCTNNVSQWRNRSSSGVMSEMLQLVQRFTWRGGLEKPQSVFFVGMSHHGGTEEMAQWALIVNLSKII